MQTLIHCALVIDYPTGFGGDSECMLIAIQNAATAFGNARVGGACG